MGGQLISPLLPSLFLDLPVILNKGHRGKKQSKYWHNGSIKASTGYHVLCADLRYVLHPKRKRKEKGTSIILVLAEQTPENSTAGIEFTTNNHGHL